MSTYRYERKYHIHSLCVDDVVETVKTHPLLFKEIFYEREVNSMYFDTPTLDNYYDSISGVPQRAKIRVRWYNKDFENMTLEIKVKNSAVGKKLSHKIKGFQLNENIRQGFCSSIQEAKIPDDIKIKLVSLIPTSINRFKRRYFISADKKFRITLDYDLRFRRILSSSMKPGSYTKIDHIIMEIKYESEDDINFSKVSNFFPLRIDKFSKYCKGISSI